MIPDVESMPNLAEMSAEALRKLSARLLGQLGQKSETIMVEQLNIEQLIRENGIVKRRRFGRRSEQLERGQRRLLEESIDEDLGPIGIEFGAPQGSLPVGRSIKRPRRVALRGHLFRRAIHN